MQAFSLIVWTVWKVTVRFTVILSVFPWVQAIRWFFEVWYIDEFSFFGILEPHSFSVDVKLIIGDSGILLTQSVWILDRYWCLCFSSSPKTVARTEKFEAQLMELVYSIRFLACHKFEQCIDMRSLSYSPAVNREWCLGSAVVTFAMEVICCLHMARTYGVDSIQGVYSTNWMASMKPNWQIFVA